MTSTTQQQTAIDKLKRLKVGALFMEMGTGKTKVALDLIASRADKTDYVLWICPCALKGEIEREREKWHPEIALDVVGCESIGASDRIYLETLEKVLTHTAFIVVDESLKIKNRRAKRTQRIIEMGDLAQYKLVLNGTPVSKSIIDLWSQMEFLSPKILGLSYLEFRDQYCAYYTSGPNKGRIKGTRNVVHLMAKIEPYVFDCELDIKARKNYETRNYHLNRFEDYETFKDWAFDQYYNPDRDELNFDAFSIALQRFYTSPEHTNKYLVLRDLIKEIGDRVIIFVRYLSSIPDGKESITGVDSTESRAEKLRRFEAGEFRELYITYGCGSYGLNLQFCHNVIFAEQVWDYALRTQAEARIYRMGQEDNANYYTLVCDEVGLENLISRCISRKSSLLDDVKRGIAGTKGGAKAWLKSI